MSVGLLIILSPLTSGSGVHAPYRGSWVTSFGMHGNGCANAGLPVKPSFSLASGRGGLGVLDAQAATCPRSVGGQGSAGANTYLVIWVKVAAPNGYHNLIAHLNDTWSVANQISTGSGCPAPVPFASNYSYAPPNASYAYWENVTGADSYCQVQTRAEANAFVQLVDQTNQTVINPSSPGCPSTCGLLHSALRNDSSTGWEFYNYTYYNHGNWTYVSGVTSFNASNHTPRSSYHAAGSTPLTIYFNYTFVRGHSYVLEIHLHAHANARANGWCHGRASVAMNLGGKSDGIRLTGITVR